MPKPQTWKYKGKELTARELAYVYEQKTGNSMHPSTMRARLKKSGGDAFKAIHAKGNVYRGAGFMCPDGEKRTHKQIAKHFNIALSGWKSRLWKCSGVLEDAWELSKGAVDGCYKNPVIKRTAKTRVSMPKKVTKVVVTEAMKRQRLLDAIPSPTRYEHALYERQS